MPRTPLHALTWSQNDSRYALSVAGQIERRFRLGDEQAWQDWLRAVTSFAFQGASGSLNVYQEARPRGGRYWYAYHTAEGRTRKRYLGRTVTVSLARLEEVARALSHGQSPAPSVSVQAEQGTAQESRGALFDARHRAEPAVTLPSTKLAPPRLPTALVGRERLLADLDAAFSTPVTLLSASAGWGKTTLLSAWARRHPGQIAWLALDALDDELARFWIAVIAALRTRVPGIGTVALAMLRSPRPPSITAIVTDLLNELAGGETQDAPILLLLDDYQIIGERAIHESLQFAVEHLPAQMHLLISSRVDPDLPLARLRVRGQLTELRAADLRFTPEDTDLFLRQTLGFPLAAGEVQVLEQRTEGWIAGLQLAALSLRKQEDRTAWLATFAGSHRYLLDYVQDEILAPQPLSIQRFLLQVAVLRRMNAALCEAVTGEPKSRSQEILEALERANLFVVPLDERRQWYRLHDLFREALLAQVEANEPGLLAPAHQRAARWYAARGEMREAITHALAAEDYPVAASLIARAAPTLWLNGEAQTVHLWLHALPDSILWQHARLVLDASLHLLESLHATAGPSYTRARIRIEQMLTRIEAGLRTGEGSALPAEEIALIRRRLRLLRALIETRAILPRDDAERLSQLAEEIAGLAEQEELQWKMIWLACIFWLTFTIRHEGTLLLPRLLVVKQEAIEVGNHLVTIRLMAWLALIYGQAGLLHRSEQECMEMFALGERLTMNTAMTGYLHLQLGLTYYAWNRLEEAADSIQMALRIAQTWQQMDLLALGNLLLASLERIRGTPATADRALQEAETVIRQEWYLHFATATDAARAGYWLAMGDLARATEWSARTVFDPHTVTPNDADMLLTQVRIALARAQYPEALAMLERFAPHLDLPMDHQITIEFLVLNVVALHQAGRTGEARTVAARLFSLTEPEGWLRVYLDAGPPMEQALHAFLDTQAGETPDAPALPHAYIARLLAAFAQKKERISSHARGATTASPPLPSGWGGAPAASALIEPLTGREREVLRALADGASNHEIAAALSISLATVKKHVSNLLGKLGVQSRTQAIARARATSLL